MSLLLQKILIVVCFALGAGVAAWASLRLLRELRAESRGAAGPPAPAAAPRLRELVSERRTAALLIVLVVAGFAVRFEGIERRGIAHVEVYVPGIALPAGISEPPPRTGIRETVEWHFFAEPHPQAYYFFMWGWAKLFGTDLVALRLPSLLFGVASIVLVFWLGAAWYGRGVGLWAAALLAFNGHHVYWSQLARMYSMATLLGLISILLWLHLMRQTRRRPGLELAYAGVNALGLYTQLYFWPFLAAQMLFTWLQDPEGRGVPRLLFFQVLAVVVGAPLWTQAVINWRPEYFDPGLLAFSQDLLNFGFLFRPEHPSLQARDVPPAAEWLLSVLALALLARGLTWEGARWRRAPSLPPPPTRLLAPLALGVALLIASAAAYAWWRNLPAAATAVVPLLAVAGLVALPALRPRLAASWRRLGLRPPRLAGLTSPLVATAFVPFLALLLLSLRNSLLFSRGLLLCVPSLLVVFAWGLDAWGRTPARRAALALVLAVASGASILHFRAWSGPRDYRGLAGELRAELAEGDLLFVLPRSWVATPVFYHLQGEHHRLVGEGYADVLRHQRPSRVWVLLLGGQQMSAEMVSALEDFRLERRVEARRAEGLLYVRGDPGVPP